MNRGFTLIELLISIAIIGILFTVTIVNFRQGKYNDDLRLSADRLASDLRELQNFALTGFTTSGSATGVPSGGYGIVIVEDDQGYFTFMDDSDAMPNRLFQFGPSDEDDTLIASGATTLPQYVSVASVALDDDDVNCPEPDVGTFTAVFAPPAAAIYFCGVSSTDTASVTLQHAQTGETRTVEIGAVTGRITVL